MSLIKAPYYFLILAIGLLLVMLPQINLTDYVQPTITSKFIVFVFSVLVILGSFITTLFLNKSKVVQITELDIILFLLLAYISLNRYAIQSHFGFSIRFFEILGLGVLYVVLRNLTRKVFVWLLLAIVVSGFLQAVYGNLQLIGYYPSNHSGFKLTGSFFNPGPYAGFIASVFPIALALYLFKDKAIDLTKTTSKNLNTCLHMLLEYIPLLGIISMLLVLPASQSRGAWLAVIISSTFLIEYKYRFISKYSKSLSAWKKTVILALSVCIITLGTIGMYQFKKGSANGRLFIWEVTSNIIKDNSIFGIGFDRFKAHYMDYQANYFVKNGETQEALIADNTYYAFNEWLQFLAEEGLVGGILLFALIGSLLMARMHTDYKYQFLAFTSICCLLPIGIFALFSYPMQILPIKLIIVVLVGLLANLSTNAYTWKINTKPKRYIFNSIKLFTIGLCVVVGIKSFEYSKQLEQSFKTWQNGLNIYQYGDYEGAINEYKKAYPLLKKDGDFLMNYGKALVMDKNHNEAVQILEEAKQYLNTTIIETALGDAYKGAKQYNNAEIAYKRAYSMIPTRFYPLYLQAKLYEDSGENEKAIAIAQSILKKDIKVPSTAIREIKAEMKQLLKITHDENKK